VPRTDLTGLERGRRRTRQEQIFTSGLEAASLAAEASEPKGLSALAGGRLMKPWIARSTPYEETRLFYRTGFRSSTLFRNYDPAV